MAPPANDEERARKRGRTLAVGIFGAVMTAFTGVCTAQILIQVWAPQVEPSELDCRQGLKALITAVYRARTAAAETLGGERVALQRFRRALEPEWSQRPTLTSRCEGDAFGRQGLKEIDRLRYAEEHAVRYEAAGLARLRQRIVSLEAELASPPASR